MLSLNPIRMTSSCCFHCRQWGKPQLVCQPCETKTPAFAQALKAPPLLCFVKLIMKKDHCIGFELDTSHKNCSYIHWLFLFSFISLFIHLLPSDCLISKLFCRFLCSDTEVFMTTSKILYHLLSHLLVPKLIFKEPCPNVVY